MKNFINYNKIIYIYVTIFKIYTIKGKFMGIAEDEIKKFENSSCAENNVFYQAMEEVISSIAPLLESDEKYKKNAILERLVVPDRIFKFKVLG